MSLLRPSSSAAAAAASAFRRLSTRLFCSSAAGSPTLLGYFHQPKPLHHSPFVAVDKPEGEPFIIKDGAIYGGRLKVSTVNTPIRFEPASPSSPPLTLDFLPEPASRFDISDSHLGLLLLRRRVGRDPYFLACDPVRCIYAVLPPIPAEATKEGSVLIGTALLSRGEEQPLDFDAICLTMLATGCPRAWIASYRDNREVCWRPLPPCEGELLRFAARGSYCFEPWCVHAAGGLFWHLHMLHCRPIVLMLDSNTLEFSKMRIPNAGSRIGETPDADGLLCSADLCFPLVLKVFVLPDETWCVPETEFYKHTRLSLLVKAANRVGGQDDGWKGRHGWILKQEISLGNVFKSVDSSPLCTLSNIDAGRTGKVFIKTLDDDHYSYNMNSGEIEHLVTEKGEPYGTPLFAYVHASRW